MQSQFYYVYVLRSLKDGMLYTGYTNDLRRRVEEHHAGVVRSTQDRQPLELVYYEACRSQADATKREKYLKTAWGKRYIKGRIAAYLMG
jgi:putative endonuclease